MRVPSLHALVFIQKMLSVQAGFLSRDVVLGEEIAFVGRENVKNILKTNKICYCLGGGFKT